MLGRVGGGRPDDDDDEEELETETGLEDEVEGSANGDKVTGTP